MSYLETVSWNCNNYSDNDLQTTCSSKPWARYFCDAEARFYFIVFSMEWDFPSKVLETLQSNQQGNFQRKKALCDTLVKCLYVHIPKSDILDIDSPKIYICSFQKTFVCLQKSGHQQIINVHNRWRQKRKTCKLTRWFLPHHLVLEKVLLKNSAFPKES